MYKDRRNACPQCGKTILVKAGRRRYVCVHGHYTYTGSVIPNYKFKKADKTTS